MKPKGPPYRGAHIEVRRQDKMRLASRPRAAASCRAPAPAPPSCIAIAMRSMQPLLPLQLCKKKYKLNSRQSAGKVYPHEIGIQKTHTKHRKLDSQAALPHRARGRAVDGLRAQAWPLWASRCDHDPGRLSPRPAGLRGMRPARAADRIIRGPPACSPRQERDFKRTSNPR